jgi:hypothetical protein
MAEEKYSLQISFDDPDDRLKAQEILTMAGLNYTVEGYSEKIQLRKEGINNYAECGGEM